MPKSNKQKLIFPILNINYIHYSKATSTQVTSKIVFSVFVGTLMLSTYTLKLNIFAPPENIFQLTLLISKWVNLAFTLINLFSCLDMNDLNLSQSHTMEMQQH